MILEFFYVNRLSTPICVMTLNFEPLQRYWRVESVLFFKEGKPHFENDQSPLCLEQDKIRFQGIKGPILSKLFLLQPLLQITKGIRLSSQFLRWAIEIALDRFWPKF